MMKHGQASALTSPPAVRPGDTIAVVAPAGPFPQDELFRGLAWLGQRYRLKASPRILERSGYLAGDDDARAAELSRAMRDPAVRAICVARGGYGISRIAPALPWDELARAPKWIVGFSDATVLHVHAWRCGIASVHGPNVTGLGRSPTPLVRYAWMRAIERIDGVAGDAVEALGGAEGAARWTGLRCLHAGPRPDVPVEGPLVGGNLTLLFTMAAAGALTVPDGAILALEDVTERPYRVDRMLTALRASGHLARVGAVVLGGFTQCDPGPDGVTVDAVLAERTRGLGVPVLAGAPFGHIDDNRAFVQGARVRVTRGALEHGVSSGEG
jgi:muramoyltetrapeptide carboxypeptidase